MTVGQLTFKPHFIELKEFFFFLFSFVISELHSLLIVYLNDLHFSSLVYLITFLHFSLSSILSCCLPITFSVCLFFYSCSLLKSLLSPEGLMIWPYNLSLCFQTVVRRSLKGSIAIVILF